MKKSWESILTLSVVHFMLFPETQSGGGPVVETIEKLALDDFLGAVEITRISSPEDRASVRSIALQSGLKIGFGAQPLLLSSGLSLNDLDEAGRARAVDLIRSCIDEAAEMGCARVAFLTGRDPGDADRPRALDALAASLNTLCPYAGDKGLALTLETFDREVDKKALLGPSDLSAAFAQRMRADHPTFGLMYDLSHQPLLGETAREALTTLQPHLVHIHVGNAVTIPGKPAYGDLHPRFGYPESANDVPELVDFLKNLFHVGYLQKKNHGVTPWVGIEVKPQAGETSELIWAHTKRTWREAWSAI
ncbi:MAG: sugar phosphate isomerase/epimerase [Chloroflexi bacterium]|nr:sugar phosphate isomerase/epimerase [Chloroflexota bacterium]